MYLVVQCNKRVPSFKHIWPWLSPEHTRADTALFVTKLPAVPRKVWRTFPSEAETAGRYGLPQRRGYCAVIFFYFIFFFYYYYYFFFFLLLLFFFLFFFIISYYFFFFIIIIIFFFFFFLLLAIFFFFWGTLFLRKLYLKNFII